MNGLTFDLAMAVRPENTSLAAQLDDIIAHDGAGIRRILLRYRVPLMKKSGAR
jgi:hypothetical protein